jgi:hypothetical protein
MGFACEKLPSLVSGHGFTLRVAQGGSLIFMMDRRACF